MFRLDDYMEDWATRYKGLLHTEKTPRFFRCNNEFTLDGFLQNYQTMAGPVCGIITNLEGELDVDRRLDQQLVKVLFMQRASPTDYKEQASAKYNCRALADVFFVKMAEDKRVLLSTNRLHPLCSVNLKDIQYDTLSPVCDNWYELIFTIRILEHRPVCYTAADYLPEKPAV